MNALDKAFIKAYAKGTPGAAPAIVEQSEAGAQRAAAASQNRAAAETARVSPLVEVSAADGVWYRIEPPAPVPAPHFSPAHRAPRVASDVLRAAAATNHAAAESLDSLLELGDVNRSWPKEDYCAPQMRVDVPYFEKPRAEPAVRVETPLLEPHELEAFLQGAAASVVTQGWEPPHEKWGAVSRAVPDSLCQCWLAMESIAALVILEQSWLELTVKAATEPQQRAAPAKTEAPTQPAPISAPPKATVPVESPALKAPAPKAPPLSAKTAPPVSAPATPPPAPKIEAPNAEAPKTKGLAPFQAAWEVDRLNWPEECDMLARGDAFGSLAKTIVETCRRRGKKVIAITGTRRSEGRTTLALCLARRAAKEGVRVALFDADFECPNLGRRIGIDMENGWDDVLTDGQPMTEAAVSSLDDRLTVLPLGRRAAAIVSAHTVSALRQASEAFDVVLVDMGPVGDDDSADSAVESPSAAAALVVHDRRAATEADIAKAMDRLAAAGIETLGVVETFA